MGFFTPKREEKVIGADSANLKTSGKSFAHIKIKPARGGRGTIQPGGVGTLGGTAFHATETLPRGDIPPHRCQERGSCSAQSSGGFLRPTVAI